MKKKRVLTVIGLLMPLMIALVWLVYLLATDKTLILSGGAQLAPVRNATPLIMGLSIFIVGYILFMVMMFSEDIRGMFSRKEPLPVKAKKPGKTKKK